MVNVFAADLTRLYEKDVYQAYYERLPEWRKEKTDRMKTEDGKVQCVGAWALLMKAAEELDKNGVGTVINSISSEDKLLSLPFVNLSHSKKYVLCAICVPDEDHDSRSCSKTSSDTGPLGRKDQGHEGKKKFVGCDVEKRGDLRLKIAKRFFCPKEYEHLLSQKTTEDMTDLFYRYWVLKESFIKASREGMKRPLNSFQTIWKDGEAVGAQELQMVQSQATVKSSSAMEQEMLTKDRAISYYYKEYGLDEDYKAAVCATENTFSPEIIRIDL